MTSSRVKAANRRRQRERKATVRMTHMVSPPKQKKEPVKVPSRYTKYRGYGHGPIIAFTLSFDPLLWFGVAILIGGLMGFILD